MNRKDFVEACIESLDSYDTFDARDPAPDVRPAQATSQSFWWNTTGVPDTIVDRVADADDRPSEMVEIIRETLEAKQDDPHLIYEICDEQIAGEIFNIQHRFIKGICTEINYENYVLNQTEAIDVLTSSEIAEWENKDVKEIEESGIDMRVIYEGTYTDVQVKSSKSSARDHMNKEEPGCDKAVHPQTEGGWYEYQ